MSNIYISVGTDTVTVTEYDYKIYLAPNFNITKETVASIEAKTEKTDPHNDDIMLIEDSEAAYTQKKLTLKNLLNAGTFT